MEFQETKLPWNDLPVRSTGNLHTYLSEQLPGSLKDHLPDSLTLLFDPEIEELAVLSFLNELPHRLVSEFCKREVRLARFVELGLFSEAEIHSFLTAHRHSQPWVLYYSKSGGLGISAENTYGENAVYGVVPCETMPNHGVAWRRTEESYYHVWLATAPKEGQDWNWEVNIGHESAHSAFAPVPLFAQAVNHSAESIHLSSARSVQDLNSVHLAQMGYMYSEIAVAAIRGEKRKSETGLPGAERREDLYALLTLSNELMPSLGFDRALAACSRVNGVIDVEHGDESFEIGAAVMRVIPHIAQVVNNFDAPTVEWYQSIK
jgi:hypothetical protein